jgi:hypothetical protein
MARFVCRHRYCCLAVKGGRCGVDVYTRLREMCWNCTRLTESSCAHPEQRPHRRSRLSAPRHRKYLPLTTSLTLSITAHKVVLLAKEASKGIWNLPIWERHLKEPGPLDLLLSIIRMALARIFVIDESLHQAGLY